MPDGSGEITELLHRIARGDPSAADDLAPRVLRDLRRIAASHFRREREDHTLQPTALVNECYMKLLEARSIDCKDRNEFFAFAARLMRNILVDHARQHQAEKRGGHAAQVPFDENLGITAAQSEMLPELDQALERLEATHPRQARVVELRYFAGFTEEEIAKIIGVDVRTVKRDWAKARARLHGELSGNPKSEPGRSP